MQISNLLLLMIVLVVVVWFAGYCRSHVVAVLLGGIRYLYLLPSYYASLAMIWCVLPVLVMLGLWMIFDDILVRYLVMSSLFVVMQSISDVEYGLLLMQIYNVVSGVLDLVMLAFEIGAVVACVMELEVFNW